LELKNSISFEISDFTCELGSLNESDVNQSYVNGLKEQTEYIENIPIHVNVSSQKKYINDILNSEGDTICGLFINNELVGTAGVRSSTSFLKHTEVPAECVVTIGIFLFYKSYRGMGLGKTLVWGTTYLCHNSFQAEWFGAAMARGNIPSLKSFLSCGFSEISQDEEIIRVLLNYSELKRPEFIKHVAIHGVNQRTCSRLVDRLT